MSVAIVGAGPAGTRAAEVLVRAGLRPIVIDEAPHNGGRIYQRQPAGFTRPSRALYGFEAGKARSVHDAFATIRDRIDHRPDTLVWNVRPHRLLTMTDGVAGEIAFDQAIFCPGAVDRIVPVPGWTLPGVTTMGGAQVSLKTQGCAIGRIVVFLGTGPLLWLVAYQYAKAGVNVAAVLDTTPFATKRRQVPGLLRGGRTFAKGLYYVAWLRAHRVSIAEGVTEVQIRGETEVTGVAWRDARGPHLAAADAVAIGWGLKPETQLADLAGVPFGFSSVQRGWLPLAEPTGHTAVPGIYLAGDGTRVGGADVAELAGARTAWRVLADRGIAVDTPAVAALEHALVRQAPFRAALEDAFPYPAAMASSVPDDTIVCRCESITAGELRAATDGPAEELNRAKALTRVGMGRCQGRMCGPPAAEILAAAIGCDLRDVGRLRGQAPVKPIPITALAAE